MGYGCSTAVNDGKDDKKEGEMHIGENDNPDNSGM